MIEILNEIWFTMRVNKLRTFLTGVSVSWGIFMLIMLVGVSKGVVNSFTSNEAMVSSNMVEITGGITTRAYRGLKENRKITLKSENIDVLRQEAGRRIDNIMGDVTASGVTVSTATDHVVKDYAGVHPGSHTDITMLHGRFINEKDIADSRRMIVLDSVSALTLFDSSAEAIGRIVIMRGLGFKVVGVYKHNWISELFIPYTTAVALQGYDNKIERIRVVTRDVNTIEESADFEQSLRATLSNVNKHAADDESAIHIWNRFSNFLSRQQAMGVLNAAMWAVGLLTLITSIIGVGNIMFVSVRERTHIIGIQRAIGATPRHILTHIIVEGIVLTTVFGYVGIVMGMFGTELVDMAFGRSGYIKDPTVDLTLAVEVTLILVVAGALAALFPALRAIKVKPVEALRTE